MRVIRERVIRERVIGAHKPDAVRKHRVPTVDVLLLTEIAQNALHTNDQNISASVGDEGRARKVKVVPVVRIETSFDVLPQRKE